MTLKNIAFGLAATSLVAAPVAAQSVMSRDAGPSSEESELGGAGIGPALIILALAGIGMGAILLTDDDDDDVPVSA